MKLLPYKSRYILLVFLICTLFSCALKKDIILFQGAKLAPVILKAYSATFKPNDLLTINVSALDMASVRPFNLPSVSYNTLINSVTGQSKQQNYLVAEDGSIQFPVLGTIFLKSLTRSQAVLLIKEKLEMYVKNPIVNIRIVNYKISVLGEVHSPGVYTIPNERVSVLEALGMAGDLTIQGQRKNVLLIREVDGKKQFERLDLTTTDFFFKR